VSFRSSSRALFVGALAILRVLLVNCKTWSEIGFTMHRDGFWVVTTRGNPITLSCCLDSTSRSAMDRGHNHWITVTTSWFLIDPQLSDLFRFRTAASQRNAAPCRPHSRANLASNPSLVAKAGHSLRICYTGTETWKQFGVFTALFANGL